jgi:hypothetical protein
MTYMGEPYYPAWLDNLADDVTLEGAALNGTARGAETVRSMAVTARGLYDDDPTYSYVGDYGDNGFIEEYTCNILGNPTKIVVTGARNNEGKTQALVVFHRPRSSLLAFSHAMYEKFKGTPIADHFLADKP